jgi:hypothetical protein
VILLNEIIEIFDLAGLDLRVMIRIEAFDCSCVGTAFVDRDLRGSTMSTARLAKEAQRRFAVNRKSTVAPILSTAR